ncbi:bacteriophage abortive infection AbiH family protein [Vibrio harveyi]
MKLYIIGNGFDLHHKMDTTYASFGLFLKEYNYEVYELLLEHYGFSDLNRLNQESMSDPLWSEFEKSLSILDTTTVLEASEDYLPNYSSDEFRDRDRYAFEFEMEKVLKLLTSELYAAFKQFILSVEFPVLAPHNLIDLDKDALYLNFNYTDTLYKYYGISDDNVLFIHEKARNDEAALILGHGVDPENFTDKQEVPPKGLSEEEYEQWVQYQSDNFDYSYELGKTMINNYFIETFKSTDKIIEKYSSFFSNLSSISEVFVLGHSLAEVDLPYFKVLATSLKPQVKWTVTYHSDSDKVKHQDVLQILGILNAKVVRMEDI